MPYDDRPRRRRDDDDDDDRPRRRDRDEEEADERPRRRRDDDDDRPRRRRRDEDDYDDRPRRRKSGSSTGVIVGSVLGLLLLAAVGGAVLWFAYEKMSGAKAKVHDLNNLKQLSLAMHNHRDSKGNFPRPDGTLSWRYHLLPYVEQESVYRAMNPNEPWDGPTNRRYADTRIATFVARNEADTTAETRYRVFVGPDTLFAPGKRPLQTLEITDGISNTILVAEAGERVPWPQPKELDYARGGPVPRLGGPNKGGFLVAMVDGSVRYVSDKTSQDVIRGGIEPRDGKLFPID